MSARTPELDKSSSIPPHGATPAERQLRWQETEIYSLVHFGINTFTGKEWGFGDESPALFNPTAFDADQWARVCRESGLRGLILVCKHHDGFCLWPTRTTEHCVRNSPWKNGQGDMVAEVAVACRRNGLKFGTYLSPWDRNHPEYGRPGYVEVYHEQLRELLTGYGELFEVWFDGANGGDGYYGGTRERRSIDPATYYEWETIKSMCRKHQPEACLFGVGDIRYVGNECGYADETCWATFEGNAITADGSVPLGTGLRNGGRWMPAECDFPLRKGWFYREGDEIRQPEQLFELYFKSVGRGATMNFGLAPDTRGRIHEDDIKSLQEWNSMIRETFLEDFLRTIPVDCNATSTRANDNRFSARNVLDGSRDTFWAADDEAIGPELVFSFEIPVEFNVVEIGEYLPLGQRVESFAVDAWIDEAWSAICAATSIGYKRLLLTNYCRTTKLRIRFLQCPASPAIVKVGLFKAPLNMVLSGKLNMVRNREGHVSIQSSNSGLSIRYTLDGSEPDSSSPVYEGPFHLPAGGTVRAYAFASVEGEPRTPVLSQTFGCDRRQWKVVSVSLDSPYDNRGKAGVKKLLDDDASTYWHTYHEDKSHSAPPHEVVLDMGEVLEIKGFTFMPREVIEGTPDQYEFYLGLDGKNWDLVAKGEFPNIQANRHMNVVMLDGPHAGRFLRFVAVHVAGGADYVAVAGLGAITTQRDNMKL